MVEEIFTHSTPGRPSRPLKALRVTVLDGPDSGAVLETEEEGKISIGTSKDNAIVLTDPTVSRYHIELSRSSNGVLIEDLGSLNGTFAGSIRIHFAEVVRGTVLKLGQTTLRIDDGAEVPPKPEDCPEIPSIVGSSEGIAHVKRMIGKLANTKISVLVRGETGCGKELVARALHEHSPRRNGPFVVVDCGSMPATLIASELFGHERGAFTGAERRYRGAFERAEGGTVLLDEIGELPLQIQPALLGVLERRTFRRLGGDEEIAVDVRVVSATHRDLRAEVNRKSFRSDLYFRLSVAQIVIPPLRERMEDLEELVLHFVEEATGSRNEELFDRDTIAALESNRWTGNIRELKNVVESAIALGEVPQLSSQTGAKRSAGKGEEASEELRSYREARAAALASFERSYLGALIAQCGGNASEAARRAQMDRPYLLNLLRRHGLR